jgi:hypothetical protein
MRFKVLVQAVSLDASLYISMTLKQARRGERCLAHPDGVIFSARQSSSNGPQGLLI